MSEPSTCRLNKQDLLIARQPLQGHFNRSELTLWLSWGTCFEANCFLLLSSKFWPMLFVSLSIVFQRSATGNQTWRNLLSGFYLFTFPHFFFSSGSHSRWINDSHLWPLCTPFPLILSLSPSVLLSDAGLNVDFVNGARGLAIKQSAIPCGLHWAWHINITVQR